MFVLRSSISVKESKKLFTITIKQRVQIGIARREVEKKKFKNQQARRDSRVIWEQPCFHSYFHKAIYQSDPKTYGKLKNCAEK